MLFRSDWLIAGRVPPIRYRSALAWLLFPLAYLVYSLIRGSIVEWYPYPFLNPATRGYSGVLISSAVIALVLAGVTVVIASVPRWQRWDPLRVGLRPTPPG